MYSTRKFQGEKESSSLSGQGTYTVIKSMEWNFAYYESSF